MRSQNTRAAPGFAYVDLPPVGTVLAVRFPVSEHEQLYTVATCSHYRRLDGKCTGIITWRSACSSCHEEITVMTGMAGRFDCHRCHACSKARRRRAFLFQQFRPRDWAARETRPKGKRRPSAAREGVLATGGGPRPTG